MTRYIFGFLSLFFLSTSSWSQDLYFPPATGDEWDTLSPGTLGWCEEKIDSLYSFLEAENSRAFILLKDGKIVLEQYFGDFTQTDSWYWASAGKGITAFMTGIAQQENHLLISDTTSQYLGSGWTSTTPEQEDNITIWNQLTMTSGLKDDGADPFCTLDTCLLYEAEAGTRWAYHNAPYTLLDQVIANATGQGLNLYTTQKLKTPTGMTGSFWPIGFNNVFLSPARSMARFGLLMLNNGNWNGNQIMTDSDYFNQMITPSQSLNESYGYLWWLNGQPSFMVPGSQFVFDGPINSNAPGDMYAAMGLNGQLLNVVPSENMVWLRMGDSPDSAEVPYFLNGEIWNYLNNLECSGTSSIDNQSEATLTVFPNPAEDRITISCDMEIKSLEIYNSNARVVFYQTDIYSPRYTIMSDDWASGLYYLKITLSNDKIITRKHLFR